MKLEPKPDPATHDHRYDANGKCSCGKVLPDDIRPYPQVGCTGTPWTG